VNASPTALALALARRAAQPDESHSRLALFGAFLHHEVVLQLAEPAEGETLQPFVSEFRGMPCVLAFDSEATLVAHAGGPAPYAAMLGEVLAGLLAGQGLGLVLIAPGDLAEFLGPETVDWLAANAAGLARAVPVAPPPGFVAPALPADRLDEVVGLLEARLWVVPGLTGAVLVGDGEAPGRLALVLSGVPGPAQPAAAGTIARMVEAAGLAVALDVGFAPPGRVAALAGVGRVLTPAPAPAPPQQPGPKAPGMDPDRPPRLR